MLRRTYAVRSPGANVSPDGGRCSTTVSASSWEFVPVELGIGTRDDRPGVRVGGRFAGEVPGVEFGEGGVDVVEVEHDDRHDPSVGVDLGDAE